MPFICYPVGVQQVQWPVCQQKNEKQDITVCGKLLFCNWIITVKIINDLTNDVFELRVTVEKHLEEIRDAISQNGLNVLHDEVVRQIRPFTNAIHSMRGLKCFVG